MLTPRKDEVAQVTAILDSDEFETSAEMAKVLLVQIAGMLSERDSYGVGYGLKTDELRLAKGPYWGKTQANREVRRLTELGLVAWAAPLHSTVIHEDKVAKGRCARCKHDHSIHHSSWGCCVTTKREGKCPCGGFVK